MPQKLKENKPTKRSVLRAYKAAGILQDREPKRSELKAVAKLGKAARKAFAVQELPVVDHASLSELYNQTAYWHGSGRFQRHNGQRIDVLQKILDNGTINPALDPYVPELGNVKSISLTKPRLYARAYADMHSDTPGDLKRFIPAREAANFYLVRPSIRYIWREIGQHDKGRLAGYKDMRAKSKARHGAMNQTWQTKVTTEPVSEMQTFQVGSDIAGNYPILFGINQNIVQMDVPNSAINETREVRAVQPIPLANLTHVEVPFERINDISALFKQAGVTAPVVAIEAMEQLMATKAMAEVLLGRQQ